MLWCPELEIESRCLGVEEQRWLVLVSVRHSEPAQGDGNNTASNGQSWSSVWGARENPVRRASFAATLGFGAKVSQKVVEGMA